MTQKKRNNKKDREDTASQAGDAGKEEPSVTDLLVKNTDGSGKESSAGKTKSRKERKRRKAKKEATVSSAAGEKNVMEDLLHETVPEHTRTDQETMDALYQIGIEGSREEAADAPADPDAAAPS